MAERNEVGERLATMLQHAAGSAEGQTEVTLRNPQDEAIKAQREVIEVQREAAEAEIKAAEARACPQLGEIFTRTDQNQTRNGVL
jgi:hypothetical protein